MVPLTTISLGSVLPRETASAAGIANFGRTLGGAIATAVVTTYWTNQARSDAAQMAGSLNGAPELMTKLQGRGFSTEQARGVLDQTVMQQATAVGTTHLFMVAFVLFVFAASAIWLAPRPPRNIKPAAGH